ncbi:MAG: hypothetical protein HYW90_00845 [Candidatus Sungbacteria bacterium]|nr:hypothetical protein [Candidatus Sungbacteria bacterium]
MTKIQNSKLVFEFLKIRVSNLFRVSSFPPKADPPLAEGFRISRAAGAARGFGLIEVVVGAALVTLFLFGIAEVGKLGSRLVDDAGERLQAAFIIEEGIDAVRGIRDSGWSNGILPLVADTDYWLFFEGTRWTHSTSSRPFIDGKFDRRLQLSQVQRDASDDIVLNGGTNDPNTRKVAVSVSWQERGATTTMSVSTYITNLFNN